MVYLRCGNTAITNRACFRILESRLCFYSLFTILSLTTSILVSLPHLGQQRGNFTSTVSSYIFTSVFSLQAGHGIQCGVRFSLFIVLTSGFRIYEIGYIVLHISSNVRFFSQAIFSPLLYTQSFIPYSYMNYFSIVTPYNIGTVT